IAEHRGYTLRVPGFRDLPLTDGEHFGADITDNRAETGAAGHSRLQRNVGGTACDIDQLEGRRAFWRIETNDQVILPEAVQAPGHEIVHEVVALGDAAEDLVDEPLPLALRDLAKAERGFASRMWVLGAAHGAHTTAGQRAAIATKPP